MLFFSFSFLAYETSQPNQFPHQILLFSKYPKTFNKRIFYTPFFRVKRIDKTQIYWLFIFFLQILWLWVINLKYSVFISQQSVCINLPRLISTDFIAFCLRDNPMCRVCKQKAAVLNMLLYFTCKQYIFLLVLICFKYDLITNSCVYPLFVVLLRFYFINTHRNLKY